MIFRKYICKSCFTIFIKDAQHYATSCLKCKNSELIFPLGEFERRQPWPRVELHTTGDKIDCVPFRKEEKK